MKLTAKDHEKIRSQCGVTSIGTAKCDACGCLLSYLRHTIRGDPREFCCSAERDREFFSEDELLKHTKGGACILCRGQKDRENSPYCTNCAPLADPRSILTIDEEPKTRSKKGKKSEDTTSTREEKAKNTMRIHRHRRNTTTPNPQGAVDTNPSA